MDQPTKIITKQKDGTHKLKYNTTKHRTKYATANIYRDTNDVRTFNSSTALREKRVHDTTTSGSVGKKRRKRKDSVEEEEEEEIKYFGNDNDAEGLNSIGRTAVIVSSKSKLQLEPHVLQDDGDTNMLDGNINIDSQEDTKSEEESDTNEELITGGTIFLTELELSSQRNGSQLFHKLIRQLNPMCKSIAELVHYSEQIVNLLYAYLLSPRTAADGSSSESVTPTKRPNESWKAYQKHLQTTSTTNGYTVNVCTIDVLHLFGVLGRELQSEIYPYLFIRIVPRIVDDMLNPPSTTTVGGDGEQRQNVVPLDVSYIEAAFRTISYLFKYNSDQIIHNQLPKQTTKSTQEGTRKQQQTVGDADILRQYYGSTICNKRDVIRRLSCESYAPILRKCTDKGLKRHLSKTIKALASSLANATAIDEDGNEESMTFSAQRAKNDAIDGVSTLLYEIARGSPGRLHSKKGRLVVKIILDTLLSYAGGTGGSSKKKKDEKNKSINVQLEKNKAEAVYNVTSQFLYKLRGHVAQRTQNTGGEDTASKSFQDVLDELHKALNVVTSVMKDKSSTSIETSALIEYVSGHVIDLMIETINFQDGRLFISTASNNLSSASVDRVVNSLQTLLNNDNYSNVGHKLQHQILNYLCSAWRHNPSHPSFALRLGKFFPSIVSAVNISNDDDDTSLDPALFLGRHLLPYLPKRVAATYLIPALLGAAATSSSADSSLVLLQTIATTVWPNNNDANEVDIDDTAVDAMFTLEAAEYCPALPAKVRSSLFDICVSSSDVEDLARLGYISRCIPFLVCLECSGSGEGSDEEEEDDCAVDNSHLEEVLNRVFKWYAMVLKKLDARKSKKGKKDHDEQGSFIVQAFILESFSKSAIECHKRISSSIVASQMEKTLTKVKTFANTLLYQHPTSLWVVKGVAAVTKALSTIEPGSRLNDKSNDTFELLVTNLAQPNHYLRMYTLQILDSYPSRPFITDHAELDLTDDLDEDPSYKPQPTAVDEEEGGLNPVDNSSVSLLSGPCDVISLMKALESIPIALPNERKFTSQLNRIEVYARTGKLPIIYAEAVVCHMLGLLHVKFSPIWPFAVKVIVSLSQAQEGPAWPYIETALKKSMKKSAVHDNTDSNALDLDDEETSSDHTKAITNHHKLCIAWDASKGKIVDIFQPQDKDRNAQVSRHVVSDELTLFENIWLIMQDGPHLTSTKSKIVVPIFFEFLVAQYYVFHQDEPDSRETDLTGLVE